MKNVAAVTSKTYDIAVRNAAKYTTSTLEKYMNNLNQVLTIPKSLFIIIILMKRIFEEYGGLNYIVHPKGICPLFCMDFQRESRKRVYVCPSFCEERNFFAFCSEKKRRSIVSELLRKHQSPKNAGRLCISFH